MQTPPYAVEAILPYLRRDWQWWESAAGQDQLIINTMRDNNFSIWGMDVRDDPVYDFFTYTPDVDGITWDAQITNYPFSIKGAWFRRSFELGKPFCLLTPIETLEIRRIQEMIWEHKQEISYLIPSRRIDFWTSGLGWNGSGAQMPTMWVTWKLELPEPYYFVDIPLKTKKTWKEGHKNGKSQ